MNNGITDNVQILISDSKIIYA